MECVVVLGGFVKKLLILIILIAIGLFSCEKKTEKPDYTGTENYPCKSGVYCNYGLTCVDDICKKDIYGDEGEPCYPSGKCKSDLVCEENICVKKQIFNCGTINCENWEICESEGICILLNGRCNEIEDCTNGFICNEDHNCVKSNSLCIPNPCTESHKTKCLEINDTFQCNCDDNYVNEGGNCYLNNGCHFADLCGENGTCNDESGEVICECVTGYSGNTCEDCAEGFHINGDLGCITDELCENYEFQKVGYIYDLHINNPSTETPCCFDYNGDGIVDNKMGEILYQIGNIGGIDYDEEIDIAMKTGEICLLLDFKDLDNIQNDDFAFFSMFNCVDTDLSYDDNLIGDEHFFVKKNGFAQLNENCYSSTINDFETVKITSYNVLGSSKVFKGLPIPFIQGRIIITELQNAKIEATLSSTFINNISGIKVNDTKLGGALKIEDFYEVYNSYYKNNCACLNINNCCPTGIDCEVSCADENLITLIPPSENNPKYSVQCNYNSSISHCDNNCEESANYCSLVATVFSPDVDLNNDLIKDAFSIGIELEATSAFVEGLVD